MRKIFLIAVMLTASACSKPITVGELYEKNRPSLEATRTSIAEAISALPPIGELDPELNLKLDPAPYYKIDGTSFADSNVAFFDARQFGSRKSAEYDLKLPSELEDALRRMTEPHFTPDMEATDAFFNGFAEAAATKYVAISRVATLNPVVAVDSKTYVGGELELEVVLLDIASGKPMVVCRIATGAPEQMTVQWSIRQDLEHKQTQLHTTEVKAYVEDAIRKDAQLKIGACLSKRTGVKFVTGFEG